MRLKELCNRDVVIIEPSASIVDAAKLMKQYNVGDVVVVEKQQGYNTPVGILTDRDIVVELVADEVDISRVSVADVMSIEIQTANVNEDSADVLKRMKQKNIRRLPVVDDESKLQGLITVADILDLLSEEQLDISSLLVTTSDNAIPA
ncbi:MAG: CBS domain-containing protein [Gammaproteobacteria bacterium]|nr:CBS domain-containing protein [Gammaproteobacteria bacterium]